MWWLSCWGMSTTMASVQTGDSCSTTLAMHDAAKTARNLAGMQ